MLQELLEAEMDTSIGYSKNEKQLSDSDNKRNGYSSKTVKTQFGQMPIQIPRDRNDEFEPTIIPKYQRDISGIEVSAEMVSKITDKILPEIKEWQSRALNPIYPFVFMDAIHYKIREDGRMIDRAAYVVLGVT